MSAATSSGRIEANGKQLLIDNVHFADCRDEESAKALRDALDFAGVAFTQIPQYAVTNIMAVLR